MHTAFLAAALVLGAAPQSDEKPSAPTPLTPPLADERWVLPKGPIASALGRVSADLAPATAPEDLARAGEVPGYDTAAMHDVASWRAWIECLALERDHPPSTAARRARLALFALAQDRWEDAWRHFEACSDSPEWMAAMLPRFLPGVPAHTIAGRGGMTSALPDGVVLTPALPPPSTTRTAGRVDRRSMSLPKLAIGAAELSLVVSVESEGVQIDITHRSGGAARFSVRIPEPPEFSFSDEYLDWYRVATLGEPIAVEIAPGADTRTLYARFQPRELALPRRLPTELPSQLAQGTLWIEIAPGDPERPFFVDLAAALVAGKLCPRATVVAPGIDDPLRREESGIAIDLSSPAERAAKLAWLASAIDQFMLRPPR